MKKTLISLLVAALAVVAPAAGYAGWHHSPHRYYGGGYRHYSHSYHHDHHWDYFAPVGIGLITGVALGALLYQPPVERTVVYAPPPPVVYPQRVVIERQVAVSPTSMAGEILRYVRPTVRLLNLRSGPGIDEGVVGETSADEVLGVVGAAPGWLYVKTGDGSYGWVMAQYTQALDGPVG